MYVDGHCGDRQGKPSGGENGTLEKSEECIVQKKEK
jgi:hypothetical protein